MRQTFSLAAFITVAISFPTAALAARVSINLSDIQQQDSSESSALDNAIAQKLRLNLSDSLVLDGDTLILEQEIEEQVLDDSCNGSKLRQGSLSITLPPQSKFTFDYRSVLQPVSVAVDTRARIEASGSAVQYFGIGNKENCTRLGSDNFDFSVAGELNLELQVALNPNAAWRTDDLLRLSPQIELTVQIGNKNFAVDVGSTILKSLLKDRLEEAIDDGLSTTKLDEGVERARLTLQRKSESTLGDGTLDIELPDVNSQFVTLLRGWTDDSADFPVSEAYLTKNGDAILRAALIGDNETLSDLLGSLLACQLGGVYLEDLLRQALYTEEAGACVATTALDTALFSDAQCQQPVSVTEQSLGEFCLASTDKNILGDGSDLPAQLTEWQLTPGPRLAITLPSFEETTLQPYQGSVSFKQDTTERGTCSLEMRIYTPNPGAKNLRPVLAFHGGSWSQRGAGFLGMESLMAHFSSRDIIVFAPFYRLAGDQDGPAACRQFVAEDIVADAVAAVDWVKENGGQYGARAGKVGLFGQSAGGFLAAYAAVERSSDIDAALLMYPPTDVGAFIDDLESGVYSNQRGVGILERFLGVEQATWYDDPARIAALSMAQQINDGATAPPIRMIHGLADELVLPNQSERLCDALSGANLTEAIVDGRLQRRDCAEQGQLDLIVGAQHALEVCAVGTECKAGDLLSAAAAQNSLRQAYDWLASFGGEIDSGENEQGSADDPIDGEADSGEAEPTDDTSDTERDSSGGGGALVYLPILAIWLRRQ